MQIDPDAAVAEAIRAPSSHNTQPWLFRIAGDHLGVMADRSRALPVADPQDRELVISCGAAIGIIPTQSPSTTTRNSRVIPAKKQESRPRPPERTLITDCPIMAQPAMPPMKPVAKLATPCP